MDLTLFYSFWARHFPSELPNPNFEMTIQLLLSSCHFKRKKQNKNKNKTTYSQNLSSSFLFNSSTVDILSFRNGGVGFNSWCRIRKNLLRTWHWLVHTHLHNIFLLVCCMKKTLLKDHFGNLPFFCHNTLPAIA